MGLGERRNKDQAMAAALKAAKVERTTGRCPICHSTIGNGNFMTHSNTGACKPKKIARHLGR